MEYWQTWFNKHHMTMRGGMAFGRILWVYHYVEVIGSDFTPMNRKNDDGSIDVLGVTTTKISSGLSYGGHSKAAMQSRLPSTQGNLKTLARKSSSTQRTCSLQDTRTRLECM